MIVPKVVVERVVDKATIKRLRNKLARIKKSLNEIGRWTLTTDYFAVAKAKTFISLINERDKLLYEIDELVTEPSAYKIKLSCGPYVLPEGYTELTLARPAFGSQLILKEPLADITVKNLANRILVLCEHPEMKFCLVISKKEVELYTPN